MSLFSSRLNFLRDFCHRSEKLTSTGWTPSMLVYSGRFHEISIMINTYCLIKFACSTLSERPYVTIKVEKWSRKTSNVSLCPPLTHTHTWTSIYTCTIKEQRRVWWRDYLQKCCQDWWSWKGQSRTLGSAKAGKAAGREGSQKVVKGYSNVERVFLRKPETTVRRLYSGPSQSRAGRGVVW